MLHNLCIGKYPVSKTLKFELRPIGRTLQHMVEKDLLREDEHRADSHEQVKKMMDDYHKAYIDERLKTLRLPVDHAGKLNSLQEYMLVYDGLDKGQKTSPVLDRIKKNLYKLVAAHLQDSPKFERMFKKEIIKEDLKNFVGDGNKNLIISEFDEYTTYFMGYHNTRKQIYSKDGIQNSVPYRLVDDNLKIFIDNMHKWERTVKQSLDADSLQHLYDYMQPYLNWEGIDGAFMLENFNLVLTQQDIDVYNTLLGGVKMEDGTYIPGLNVLVNLYNQKRTDKKFPKLPLLEKLKKQILSDRVVLSWMPDKFETDAQLVEAVARFSDELFEGPLKDLRMGGRNLLNLVTNLDAFDENHLYIGWGKSFGDISWALFGNPKTLHRLAIEDEKKHTKKKKRETEMDWESRIKKLLTKRPPCSVAYLNNLADNMVDKVGKTIQRDYFSDMDKFFAVAEQYSSIQGLLSVPYPENRKLSQDTSAVDSIRDYLKAVKDLQLYVKPLAAGLSMTDADALFYAEFGPMWEILSELDRLYDKVSTYLNRKPYSNEKIKLNFRNVGLLSGWSTSKRRVSCSTILRKDDRYFLAISDSEHRGVLEEKNISAGATNYQLMDYRMLPKAAQMMPGMFLCDSGIRTYHPSDELIEGYRRGAHLKNEECYSVDFMRQLVDYFKSCLLAHPEYGTWGLQFSDTSAYADISGFYREVDRQTYRVKFVDVDEEYIDRLVEEGKLYLFRIWNRDFSPASKGRPQLHTMYFRALFEERNLTDDRVYKLNGGGEMFYRKASIPKKKRPTHPAGVPIDNKNPLNPKRQSVFSYDLMKDRRYMDDRFFLHIPLTMNWQADAETNLNGTVNDYIREHDVNVIGIARGESNLLYACVVGPDGNIIEKHSLNAIASGNGEMVKNTDYYRMVCDRLQQRNEQQKAWKPVQNIKELMEGYTGQVVHKIVQWMEKYNAVVVLENPDFLARVGKPVIDRTMLGKFERQLIEKLNYLVRKDRVGDEAGSVYRAIQLTGKFESFEKIGNQSGALFFVSGVGAAMTDPVTGYYSATGFWFENIEQARKTLSLLDGITYDARADRFIIDIDFSKFTQTLAPSRTCWRLQTWGTRFRNRKTPANKWATETVELTRAIADLFVRFGIDLHGNILEQILEKTGQKAPGVKDFLLELMSLLQMTVQVRHVNMETKAVMMASPVADASGRFFRTPLSDDDNVDCPDAVTAYNIARKGLMYIAAIRNTGKGEKISLSCPYQDWLKDMQHYSSLLYNQK